MSIYFFNLVVCNSVEIYGVNIYNYITFMVKVKHD